MARSSVVERGPDKTDVECSIHSVPTIVVNTVVFVEISTLIRI